MNKIYTLFLFSLFSITTFAQIGGDLDPGFGNAGKVIKSINSGKDIARGVALLSDGSFLVVGETNSSITGKDFFCVKFTTSGTIDNTFGNNGTVTTDLQLGSDDVAHSIAVDETTGKFVLAGSSSDGTKQSGALVRYNANGQRDSTFGTNGIVITSCIANNADNYNKVKIHALSGKIIVAGSSIYSTTNATAVIARYNPDGTLDTSFDTTGINVFPTLGGAFVDLKDLYVAPSGKITAVGHSSNYNIYVGTGWITRLNANGLPDVTFGTGGAMVEEYMTNNNAMYIDAGTGDIYTAGSVIAYFGYSDRNERMTIKRAASNGTEDTWADAYGNYDHYTSPGGAPAYANAMCITPDGHFFLGGVAYLDDQSSSLLMKLNQDGTADNTFANPLYGQVVDDFGNTFAQTLDMVLQPDGKVVVVGFTGNDFFIARYFGTTVPHLSSFHLVSPANNATEQICTDVAFDWTDAPGATGYQLLLDTTLQFLTADTSTLSYSSTPDYSFQLLTATTYYWKVRAFNNDSVSAWTSPWKFTTTLDNITLITPADGATNVTVHNTALDWSDLASSTLQVQEYYEIEVSASPTFTNILFTPGTSFSNSNFSLSPDLLANTTYYWHVRSNRGVNRKGPWSPTSHFTTGTATGIQEAADLPGISIYPNPASSQLTITGIENYTDLTAQLYDAQGRITNTTISINQINLAGISSGIYFLRLNTNTTTGWYKFIKE